MTDSLRNAPRIMCGHFPYPEACVFLCIGHSAPSRERVEPWHATDLRVAAGSSAAVALKGAWGEGEGKRTRQDGRLIAPSGTISLATMKEWEAERKAGVQARAVGLPIAPRRLFRRVWLCQGSMRSGWVRASTRWQAILDFKREHPQETLLLCFGRKQIHHWMGQMIRGANGAEDVACYRTQREQTEWFPAEFASIEDWLSSREKEEREEKEG